MNRWMENFTKHKIRQRKNRRKKGKGRWLKEVDKNAIQTDMILIDCF